MVCIVGNNVVLLSSNVGQVWYVYHDMCYDTVVLVNKNDINEVIDESIFISHNDIYIKELNW